MSGKDGVSRVFVATMSPRERRGWDEASEEPRGKPQRVRRTEKKRRAAARASGARTRARRGRILPKHLPALAAATLCLGVGAYAAVREGSVSAVFSHLSAGFEYDDTLGRLQYVSNLLPESAMVFLTTGDAQEDFAAPVSAALSHAWTEQEPWLEYACTGDVSACGAGEVMAVVRNRRDESTVRLRHENGYESVYSGLTGVTLSEGDAVEAGERLGSAAGVAAFELRRDGLSVQPAFAAL